VGAFYFSWQYKQVAWTNYATYKDLSLSQDPSANDFYDEHVDPPYRWTLKYAGAGAVSAGVTLALLLGSPVAVSSDGTTSMVTYTGTW